MEGEDGLSLKEKKYEQTTWLHKKAARISEFFLDAAAIFYFRAASIFAMSVRPSCAMNVVAA